MDVLNVLALLIIIILLVVNHSGLVNRIDKLERMIFDLNNLIDKLKQGIQSPAVPKEAVKEPEKPKPITPPVTPPAPKPVVVPDLNRPFESAPLKPHEIERQQGVIEDPLAALRKTPVKTSHFEAPKHEPQPCCRLFCAILPTITIAWSTLCLRRTTMFPPRPAVTLAVSAEPKTGYGSQTIKAPFMAHCVTIFSRTEIRRYL